jgi:pilus assembly protein CpaF
MFGFKDPTRTITVMEESTSLVETRAQEQQHALASLDLKEEARHRVAERLKPDVSGISPQNLEAGSPDVRGKVECIAGLVIEKLQQRGLAGKGPVIPDDQAEVLLRHVLDWQFGAGPLEPLFHELDVEDIVVNSSDGSLEVWTYRQSGKRRESIELSLEALREIINRNAGVQGRALNPSAPILNARMRNGARINAVLSPVCDPHIAVTIRIHRLVARRFDDLVRLGTLSPAAAAWLWLCVQAGLSILVGGGTSSGKTNLLNAIASVMPGNLRCVVIEDTRELELPVPDRVYLTTVQPTNGERPITQRQLVANALRMRPDRIILGEVRDAAAWDAVKACNTGHEGTLLSVHAEDASGVLIRLAQLCGEAPETANIPERMLREVIAAAFQCVVFLERRRQLDGSYRRLVTQITEVNGLVADGVTVQKPMFTFSSGELVWTKQWPHERLLRRLSEHGFTQRDIELALQGKARLWEMPA